MNIMNASPEYKIVVVGHVDHGKSTLLGRILLDCGRLPADKIAKVERICQNKQIGFEPGYFLDALEEEQEQGISIDTTHAYFEHGGQRFLFIDAPGHLEFLKNMASGSSRAQVGLLVIDCLEGVGEQTKRHLEVLNLLGIAEIILVLNKIDLVDFKQSAFESRMAESLQLLAKEGLHCHHILPICALTGENVTHATKNMPWFTGTYLLDLLCRMANQSSHMANTSSEDNAVSFRMLLQDVYKFEQERYFAGLVVSGTITPGSRILFSPSGKTAEVDTITVYPEQKREYACVGDSIALTLTDQIFVERGELISLPSEAPEVDNEFQAKILWLDSEPLQWSEHYLLKLGTAEAKCQLSLTSEFDDFFDRESLFTNGSIIEVLVKTDTSIAFDQSHHLKNTGQFVICSKDNTVAIGSIERFNPPRKKEAGVSPYVFRTKNFVLRKAFESKQGHNACVIWLTGLSGSGKTTIANLVQKSLFMSGKNAVVLDGDNLRLSLCSDLGFSARDRSENVRRIAHTARLFLDNGLITLVACLSPFSKDREVARQIIGVEDFHEIFLECPITICQTRDPKGIYRHTQLGKVVNMTGYDAPYQVPVAPSLKLNTSKLSPEETAKALLLFLESQTSQPNDSLLYNSLKLERLEESCI